MVVVIMPVANIAHVIERLLNRVPGFERVGDDINTKRAGSEHSLHIRSE